MKYIIVDLEATCWQDRTLKHVNEIIEIGAVCVNEQCEIKDVFNAFVRPVVHPQLSEFCTRLTSISQADVDEAKTFTEVIEAFKLWIGSEEAFVICSWGFYDKKQLIADCRLHQLETGWLKHHISLKHQHAEIRNLQRPLGMGEALKLEDLELEGTHHRGIDDVKNIAKIFRKHFSAWKI